jgi:phosphohistidine phosphatase
MHLLLCRHAHAGTRDASQWPDDRDRPLTDKGRKVQADVSRFLRKRDLAPSLVLTSPWVRAAQTAEILVEVARVGQPPVPCEPLADDPDLIRLQDYVGDQPSGAIVAMVGHSPWMEELAALLLGGSSAGIRIDFPKSGVLGIDLARLEPGAGELRFFLRPKMA